MARLRQTVVAAVGVTFSITMFIALLSFMAGLNDLLDGMVMNRTAHIRLYNEIKPSRLQPVDLLQDTGTYNFIHSVKPSGGRLEIHNNGAIMNHLVGDERVLGIAPKVVTQVFFTIGNIELTNSISGISVVQEDKLFNFSDYVVAGDHLDLDRVPNSIILGKGAADKMLVKLGDMIQVSTPQGGFFPMKVVGIFQSGIQEVDKVQSYASVASVQKLLGVTESYVTDIQVKLHDMELAPAIALEYAALFDIDAEDIQTANSQFETGSSVRTLISYSVGITLLIVAGFGIYNILNMMIYEKMDTIAILKATGFAGSDIKRIFMIVALTIGFFGALSGMFFGYAVSAIIDVIPFDTAALPTIETYPVNYSPVFYVIGSVFGITTTYFAGSLPARKASKVDPVLIIRGK